MGALSLVLAGLISPAFPDIVVQAPADLCYLHYWSGCVAKLDHVCQYSKSLIKLWASLADAGPTFNQRSVLGMESP